MLKKKQGVFIVPAMTRKYVLLILDGLGDYPVDALDGKTPVEAAHTPYLDQLAQNGQTGLCVTTPVGMYTGSDNCIMGILGYEQHKYYTGRGPLEAAAVGIKLQSGDVCFRCNTLTIENGVMKDFTAGHIPTEESRQIILTLDDEIGSEDIRFFPGVSYRHLLVLKNRGAQVKCTPPHDITGKPVAEFFPCQHDDAEYLIKIMNQAKPVIESHQVNRRRKENGKLPVTDIWLWGAGSAIVMPPFLERFGLKGAMITAVDLLRGLAVLVGLKNIVVPGATGYIDTDYAAKGRYAIEALKENDFVCVHIEAPDESGHMGNPHIKTKSIEEIDAKIVGPVLAHLKQSYPDFRVLVLPDHYTPCVLKTHSSEPVPFLIYGTGLGSNGSMGFSEKGVNQNHVVAHGYDLLPILFKP